MYFTKVEISQFRNLVSSSFIPSPSLNLISGSNGSGKSSLLEALYYLSTGSSFRSNRLSNIINQQSDCFTLFTELANSHRIGIKRCKDLNHQTRLDGVDIARRSELVHLLPLQIISPESISLLLDGSDVRRSFIDWALFHVEHSFHYHLSSYTRALKQRNALLKSKNIRDIEHWDFQLLEHGLVIDQHRSAYITTLLPAVNDLLAVLLPDIEFSLNYRSGWSKELDLGTALKESLETDLKLKHTTVGPHRADFMAKSSGIKCVDVLSRGQIKLVVIALKLAQILSLRESSNRLPVILIDDIAAELDVEHRLHLLNTVQYLATQVFITTPELQLVDHSNWKEKKVFHVEHGQIKEVV